jgi:hypothetical protein
VHALAKYSIAARDLLNEQKFDELDTIADKDRTQKSKFAGGVWKLYMLYQGLKQPAEGLNASEEAWQKHLGALTMWSQTRPESATAQIALAEALLNYVQKLQNDSDRDLHPNKPPTDEDPWKKIRSVQHSAKLALKSASDLKTNCPHFYFVKLEFQEESDSSKAKALLQQATSLAPDYLPYYRVYAIHLRPEWDGEKEDGAKFAEEVSKRVGGKLGAAIYFEIAAALDGSPTTRRYPLSNMSWERICEGYAALEETYGSSLYKLNQLTFLAMRYQQTVEAAELFKKIGDQWDRDTWKYHRFYDYMKEYATAPAEIVELRTKTGEAAKTTEGKQYQTTAYRDVGISLSQVLMGCTGPFTVEPTSGNDLFIHVAGDGAVQEVKSWPETKFTACIRATLMKSKLSVPPSPSYWVQLQRPPSEGIDIPE